MKPIVQRFRGFVAEASAGCGRMFRILGLAALPMVVVASGCSARGDAAPGVGEPLGVAVTVPPLEYFARAIGGDSVAVTTLLKSGSDPETFEPGVGAMKALGGSDLMLSTGLMPFEQSLAQKSSSRGGAPRIVSVSDGIDLIHGTHGHEHDGVHRHSEASDEREELYADPHIWSSVGNARIIAENVLRAFCHADTARTPYYTANYRTLIVHLDSLEGAWKGRLASVGGARSLYVTLRSATLPAISDCASSHLLMARRKVRLEAGRTCSTESDAHSRLYFLWSRALIRRGPRWWAGPSGSIP